MPFISAHKCQLFCLGKFGIMVVGALSASAALAQSPALSSTPESPYFLGAGLGFTLDSNPTRASSNEQSDTVIETSVLGGFNQTFGRQRLYLDGTATKNRYQDFDTLDNTSYELNTGILWETIGALSGSLRYGLEQTLANPALAGSSSSQRNSEKSQRLSTSLRYAMNRRVAIEGGLSRRQLDYSLSTFDPLENTQNIGNIGIVWGLRDLLRFGVGVRSTHTDTPRYSPEGGNKARRPDVDFTLAWSATSKSTINARLSFTQEDHTLASASSFDDVTGNVSWSFQPFARLSFNTLFNRDTGSESRFFEVDSAASETSETELLSSTATEVYRLTDTIQLSATYLLTSKITTTAFMSRSEGSVVGNGVNTAVGEDTVNSVGWSTNYQATRNLSLACRANFEKRSTNSSLSSTYEVQTLSCLGNIYLR